MNNLRTLTTFFGWCSVINVAFFGLAGIALTLAGESIAHIHSQMFGLSVTEVSLVYLQYLSNYKIAVIMLNIVPYITLRIMSR